MIESRTQTPIQNNPKQLNTDSAMTFYYSKQYDDDKHALLDHYAGNSDYLRFVYKVIVAPVYHFILGAFLGAFSLVLLTLCVYHLENTHTIKRGKLPEYIDTYYYIFVAVCYLYIHPTIITMLANRVKSNKAKDTM